MLKKVLIGILSVIVVAFLGMAAFVWSKLQPDVNPLPMPESLVALPDEEGQRLFADADARADYEPLLASWESQELISYCGVASGVTVLNALGMDLEQGNYFDGDAGKVKPKFDVMFGGMTLGEFAGLVAAHGANVEKRHADTFDAAQFREVVRRNLREPGDYLLVNYQREVLGQRRVGHISPIGAYDEESDSVLILDTASYNYPFTWVPVEKLYAAMSAVDPSSNRPRGYVEVSAAD